LHDAGQAGLIDVQAAQTVLDDTNQAYPILVTQVLPAGLRGIVVAGLLAALMSSLASVLNSSSTLFTIDIYKKLRPESSEHHLVWVGRLATGAMVLVSLAWIPMMKLVSDVLYVYLQKVQGYLAPPIFAVFFLGLFIPRLNGTGCMAGLIGGFILGMGRLAAEIVKDRLTPGTALFRFADVNYLYFTIFLFIAAAGIMVIASLLTRPPAPAKLAGLTYATVTSEDRATTSASWTRYDVIHSVAVICLILVIYLYFNG
ncbi:MAG: Na+/glucose cotransporter, partial [Planctomycetes bacterium]|nr:Na+/glucose cotransporter [Planctomycetota bacterium]